MHYIQREAKKLKENHDQVFQAFLDQDGASKQAAQALESMQNVDKVADLSSISPSGLVLFIENLRREEKVSSQKEKRLKETIQKRDKEIKELKMQMKQPQEQEQVEKWTPEQCLAFKVENDLSFNSYHKMRLAFGDPLVPKDQVRAEEKRMTSHMTLIPAVDGNKQRGYVVTLKLMTDAISSGKFGFAPGDNEIKLTGDGGGLHGDRPMMVMFVQSLMRTTEAQGLDGTQPVAILLEKENYKSVAVACQILNPQISEIEQKGIKVGGKTYRFEFFFTADLKYTWVVSFFFFFFFRRNLMFGFLYHLVDFGNEIGRLLLLPVLFGEHAP